MSCIILGNIAQISASVTEVNPIPIAKDSAIIMIFLCVKPALASISIPLTTIVPNIISVHPPNTDSGIELKNAPIGGTNPASIINIAPVIIVNLFTTFVIATNPTFWLNDVTGGHPNIPVIELEKPSQASEPEISLSVISLSKPFATTADVSPIVSAAETINIIHTDIIAFILNSGVTGKIVGNAIIPLDKIPDKSTIPKQSDTTYPTNNPNNTDNCFQNDFAKILNKRQATNVIVPTIIFCREPKFSV